MVVSCKREKDQVSDRERRQLWSASANETMKWGRGGNKREYRGERMQTRRGQTAMLEAVRRRKTQKPPLSCVARMQKRKAAWTGDSRTGVPWIAVATGQVGVGAGESSGWKERALVDSSWVVGWRRRSVLAKDFRWGLHPGQKCRLRCLR